MNKNLQQFLSTLVQVALRNAMPKGRKKVKQGEGEREKETGKSSTDPARVKG